MQTSFRGTLTRGSSSLAGDSGHPRADASSSPCSSLRTAVALAAAAAAGGSSSGGGTYSNSSRIVPFGDIFPSDPSYDQMTEVVVNKKERPALDKDWGAGVGSWEKFRLFFRRPFSTYLSNKRPPPPLNKSPRREWCSLR